MSIDTSENITLNGAEIEGKMSLKKRFLREKKLRFGFA
jgi:hypothetical protein